MPEDSKQIGKRLSKLEETAEKSDVTIIGLMRNGKRRYGRAQNAELRAGDAIVLEATPDALDEFRSTLNLAVADQDREDRLHADGEGVEIIEVVVTAESRLAGRTAQAVGLAWRKSTVLLGISRRGRKITAQLRKTELQAGDILLLLVPRDTGDDVTEWLGVLPLANRGLAVTENSKVWLAIALFAGAVVAASIRLIYLPIALGIVVVAYVLVKIVPLSEVYTHIEWPVVVLLGSMIPLGAALEKSGGTELIAGSLVTLTDGMPAWAVPIAASSAFLTPIGHKNNTLILGPGGYSFGDYWRIGLPLEIIIVAVSIPAILVFWPL